ncbi:class I SAM-dependent methyltransferase [Vogesella sp. LIG4]|uniref:class I SAM-dependent methyltransferase n=1 Tax=Vogesella sp. LIG4 TaxID=1192162 RepID=UPI0008201A50|nr:SAM-dependent methyltransferase [Vogesella sp. LIG4]SCK09925.1 SAM-dependent methyltransferase, MidA family [Vogesella sp. LIG4]
MPLPEASADALAVSHTLARTIAAEIADRDGWMPFSRYMELALYAPGLGYYTAGSRKFGEAGDFITAPELTPLFAQCLARQLAELLPQTAGHIVEFGAGSGRLAADLLLALQELGCEPASYSIVDLSPDLIERQQATIATLPPTLAAKVRWLPTLPDSVDGILLGNEVLDAMPVELVLRNAGKQLQQRGVTVRDGALCFEDRAFDDPQLAALADALLPDIPDYVSEISLANRGFIRTLAGVLTRGAMLMIDYGHSAGEYYHPERSMGTLLGHYRHHTLHDPFYLPGLMDLTTHVDFSAVAQAGIDAGLDLIGYTSQAQFLVNAGITGLLSHLDAANIKDYLPVAKAAQRLLSPQEMGETFKVIGFGKQVGIDWLGFSQGDRCYTL